MKCSNCTPRHTPIARYNTYRNCNVERQAGHELIGWEFWVAEEHWVYGREDGMRLPSGGRKIAVYIIDWVCLSDLLFCFLLSFIFFFKHNPVICNSHFKLHGRNGLDLNVSLDKRGKQLAFILIFKNLYKSLNKIIFYFI